MRKRMNKQRRDNILRIRVWNVRCLNVVGKLEELKTEMKMLILDIVGVIDVKREEDRDFW